MLSLVALLSLSGLLAVWVIYPLVIAALAAIAAFASRRRPASATAEDIASVAEPSVSVIVATRDDVETIRRRVIDCLQTSYDPAKLEIVVAIDGGVPINQSARDLASIADRVTVVAGDQPGGKAATLNAAVRASRGDVLVFTDAHQRFHADAIPQLVAALRSLRVGGASGCLDIPSTSGRRSLAERYWLFERWLRRCEALVHSSVGVTGAIWALRKSLWSPLPPLLILDDVYAPMQVVLRGYRVAFVQSARAIETRHHDPAQEYRRKVRTLTGVMQVCAWLSPVLNPMRNPVWLQFTFHKLLRFLTPYWVAAIGLWMAVVAWQQLGASRWLAVAAAMAAVAALQQVRPNLFRRASETVVSVTLLQIATIVGAANGFRGRWNVWNSAVRMDEPH